MSRRSASHSRRLEKLEAAAMSRRLIAPIKALGQYYSFQLRAGFGIAMHCGSRYDFYSTASSRRRTSRFDEESGNGGASRSIGPTYASPPRRVDRRPHFFRHHLESRDPGLTRRLLASAWCWPISFGRAASSALRRPVTGLTSPTMTQARPRRTRVSRSAAQDSKYEIGDMAKSGRRLHGRT